MNQNNNEKIVIDTETGVFLVMMGFWLVMCLVVVAILYFLPGF